ncbi:MAG: hypothetical protein ABFC96_09105 [Thermoguttaceae bacterium]
MELLNALLAGFFLWLLVFQTHRNAIRRIRKEAGELVLRVNAARGLPKKRWPLCLGGYLLLCSVGKAVEIAARGREEPLGNYVTVAIMLAVALTLLIPRDSASIALEVRKHGVLDNMWGLRGWSGRLSFTPWNAIDDCLWISNRLRLTGRSRLELAEGAIAMDQRAAVSAAIGQFVPVYGVGLALLAKPERPREASGKPTSGRTFRNSPFQFDLQSLLILTVAVACAANCYGIRYRRLHPRWDAMAKLEAFGPQTFYLGEELHSLDFSGCTTKPGDDDLANLEPLSELAVLDLAGTPVTDAGLRHLKGLKKLRRLDLSGTQVTMEGVEELQRALPGLRIGYAPAPGARPCARPRNGSP